MIDGPGISNRPDDGFERHRNEGNAAGVLPVGFDQFALVDLEGTLDTTIELRPNGARFGGS